MTKSHLGQKGLFQLTTLSSHSTTEESQAGTQSRSWSRDSGGLLCTGSFPLACYNPSYNLSLVPGNHLVGENGLV